MRLAHFGTFDVQNYGDLLFPLILEHEFPGSEVLHVSPVGGQPYADVPKSVSFADAQRSGRFDAIVVGGGNLIHARPTTLPAYSAHPLTTYPNIWAGAAQLAARQDIPLVFNTPGVARKFGPASRPFLRMVAQQATYFSVRDEYSRRIAAKAGIERVSVVPDSALNISSVVALNENVLEDLGLEAGTYLAVHLNERYISKDLSVVAPVLDQIAAASGRRIVLIAIGPCHGDDVLAQKLGQLMKSDPVIVDMPNQVTDIATLIARSAMYIGASLHGFITATSFNVPARIVAPPGTQHKFLGLVEPLGAESSLLAGWEDAVSIDFSEAGAPTSVVITPALQKLDHHWETLRAAATGNPGKARSILTSSRSVAPAVAAANYVDHGWKAPVRRILGR
jgi:polysaccharide pyruvyl transferase WcaK-like protein